LVSVALWTAWVVPKVTNAKPVTSSNHAVKTVARNNLDLDLNKSPGNSRDFLFYQQYIC